MPLENKLTAKDMIIGLVGVSPIPVAGEIALSAFFYNILQDTNIKHASIPAALLTRLGLYTEIYPFVYEYLKNLGF